MLIRLSVLHFFDGTSVDSSDCDSTLRFVPRSFDCRALPVPVVPCRPRRLGPCFRVASDFVEVKGASATSAGLVIAGSDVVVVMGASVASSGMMITVSDDEVIMGALASSAVVTNSVETAGVTLSYAGETSGGTGLGGTVLVMGTLAASSGWGVYKIGGADTPVTLSASFTTATRSVDVSGCRGEPACGTTLEAMSFLSLLSRNGWIVLATQSVTAIM